MRWVEGSWEHRLIRQAQRRERVLQALRTTGDLLWLAARLGGWLWVAYAAGRVIATHLRCGCP